MPISNWSSEARQEQRFNPCALTSGSHARTSGFIDEDAGAEDGVSRASAARRAFFPAGASREILLRQAQLTPQPSSQRIAQADTLDRLDRFLESVARFCFRAATVARRPRMRRALQGVGQVADGQGGRGRSRMRDFS
jgi:hypothetical protein